MADIDGPRGKSEFLKRLSAGKTLCSEVNKASSNAKFLHMRRFKAFVNQLESAKQSMLVENERAQKDVRRRLEVYKRRKRTIFRQKVLAQQEGSGEEDGDVEEEEEKGADEEEREGEEGTVDASSSAKRSAMSSLSRRRRSSGYNVSLVPPPGSGASNSCKFPAILRVPMTSSDDESIHTAIQRQLVQHMRKQESMHAQILRSRVYEFCNDLTNLQEGLHTFYITTPKRRIAFSEGTKPEKDTPATTPALPGNLKTSLVSVA